MSFLCLLLSLLQIRLIAVTVILPCLSAQCYTMYLRRWTKIK